MKIRSLFLPRPKHENAVRFSRNYYWVFQHFVIICNNVRNDAIFDSNWLAINFELVI